MGSPHGYTRQPCQGCGGTELRRKDKLCSDCQSIYDDGLLANELQSKQKEAIIVRHNKASHLISGPYLFEHSASSLSHRLSERFRKAWGRLTMSVLKPAVGGYHRDTPYLIENKEYVGKERINLWGVKNDFYGYHSDEYYLVDPIVREALNEFDMTLRLSLEFVYLAGRKQGSNILLQLNEGAASLSQFEQNIEKINERLSQIEALAREQEET